MNKNLWGIIKGIEQSSIGPKKLLEWERRDDKINAIISLPLPYLEIHHEDFEKSSKV